MILVLALAIVGMDWVTRVQMALLVLLVVSQIDFIIGSFLPPSAAEVAKGFVGYNAESFSENFFSSYTIDASGKSGKKRPLRHMFPIRDRNFSCFSCTKRASSRCSPCSSRL